MSGRWDHLYETRRVGLKTYVLEQVADQIASELRNWPPNAEAWTDPRDEERFRTALARPSRPPLDTFRVGLELARLDLLHEIERVDRFWDSPAMHALLPDRLEQDSAQFIWRWLVVSVLEFQEWAQGKFRRTDLVALIEQVEDRMVRGFALRLDDPGSV